MGVKTLVEDLDVTTLSSSAATEGHGFTNQVIFQA